MLDAWCLPLKLHLKWLPTCVSVFESFSRYDVRTVTGLGLGARGWELGAGGWELGAGARRHRRFEPERVACSLPEVVEQAGSGHGRDLLVKPESLSAGMHHPQLLQSQRLERGSH